MQIDSPSAHAASRNTPAENTEKPTGVSPSTDKTFQRLLEHHTTKPTPVSPKPPAGGPQMLELADQLLKFQTSWQQTQAGIARRIEQMPKSARSMVELQVLVNDLGIKAQVLTQLGEAVSATIKKMQQMGSN